MKYSIRTLLLLQLLVAPLLVASRYATPPYALSIAVWICIVFVTVVTTGSLSLLVYAIKNNKGDPLRSVSRGITYGAVLGIAAAWLIFVPANMAASWGQSWENGFLSMAVQIEPK
jgi:TRAP-type C4-dicarboxylate transport system permease small subunit